MKKRYPLPKGHPIKSVTIQEIDGTHEAAAMQLAAAKATDNREFASLQQDEMVRASIVEVDGSPVTQPYLPYDAWKKKTRDLVFVAYKELNAVTPAENDGFLKGGEVVD